MAIAFDNSTIKAPSTTANFTHTVNSNTNGILFVTVVNATGTDNVTGITYNSVAMTKVNSIAGSGSPAIASASMWYLLNPATGTNTVAYSGTGTDNCGATAASYTGAAQSGQPDSNAVGNDAQLSGGNFTLPTTVVASNCWLTMGAVGNAGTPTAGTGTTIRSASASGYAVGDSNATVSTGSQSLQFGGMGAHARGVIASIAPAAGGGTAAVSGGKMLLMGVGI